MARSSAKRSGDKFGPDFVALFEQKLGTEKSTSMDKRLRQEMIDLCKEALWQPTNKDTRKGQAEPLYYFTLICIQAHAERDEHLDASLPDQTSEQQSWKFYLRDFAHHQYFRCAALFAESMEDVGVRNIDRLAFYRPQP